MSTDQRSTAPAAVFALVLLGLCVGSTLGCAGDDASPPVVPADSRRNVMVIDDGIDLSLPVLRGKVAAAYTVVCATPDGGLDGGAPDGGESDFATAKAELIAALAQPDESCHLSSGIGDKVPFGEGYESVRGRWNQALVEDEDPSPIKEGLIDALDADLGALPFHGTATAGAIAFGVAQLNLFLIEQPLASAEEIRTTFTCPTQEAIDLVVTLFSDEDVRRAYVTQPVAAIDRELVQLRADSQIGLVNESFGPITRYGFQRLMFQAGCGPIEVVDYFRVLGEVTRARDDANPEPGVLLVRAAGNDGAALNHPADAVQCHPGDRQLLVGAYGPDGQRSFFTNFGACVDLYAPGQFVVAPLPGDWLALLSGTSFATPLVLRALLFLAPSPFAPDTARRALLAARLANDNLPLTIFPKQLVFDVAVAARKSALTASATPAVAGAPAPLAISTRSLRRVLWPLRWAERHQRRP